MRSWARLRRPSGHMVMLSGVLALAAGLALVVLSAVLSRSHDSARVLLNAQRMERLVHDLESGQLGFIATREERFLQPWRSARAEFPRRARELQRQAALSGPEQARRARAITTAVESFIRQDTEPSARAALRDARAARTVASRWRGNGRVKAIRARLNEFEKGEHRLGEGERATAHRALVVGSGTAGGVFAGLLFIGYLRHLERAQVAASRARLIDTTDAAARALSCHLHDATLQRLVSLGLELYTVEDTIPQENENARTRLTTAAGHLAEAIRDVQDIAGNLFPAALMRAGLAPALRTLTKRAAIPVELDLRHPERLGHRVELAIYHIVAEAVANAARHGNASHMYVCLEATAGLAHISIRDDGSGGADPEHGTGLALLNDRVEALGGTFHLNSPPGDGTTIHAYIPIGDG